MSKRSSQQSRKSGNRNKSSGMAQPIRLQALEPRVLLDAAAAQTAAQLAEHAHQGAPASADDSSAELMHALDQASAHVAPTDARDAAPVQARTSSAPVPADVYFVDRALPDVQQLINALPPQAEIHYIDSGSDGIEQIAQTLSGRHDLGAVHILSHGSEGSLQLGSGTLDMASMQSQYQDELQAIGRALSENGDILIYGCDFAAGADGAAAVQLLSSLSAADVAASLDTTGADRFGGDWALEYSSGTIDTATVSAPAWDHVMAPPTVSTGNNLLTNGSFEGTGGWTAEKGLPEWSNNTTAYGAGALDGSYQVEVEGDLGSHYIEQTVSTVAGQTYELSWYGRTRTSATYASGDDKGIASVTGVQGGDVTQNFTTGRTGWTRYTITFVASGSTATIRFTSDGNTGVGATTAAANDGAGLMLDAVRLVDTAGFRTSYTENGTGIAIASSASEVRDLDSSTLNSMKVVITNGQLGDVLAASGLPAGITASYDAATFTLTLSGSTSAVNYNTALQAVRFSSTSDNPSTVSRVLSITGSDASSTSAVSRTTIDVLAANDAPVLNTTPNPTVTVSEDAGPPAGAVGSLVSDFTIGATDAEAGALKGIAVTGSSTGNGTWWYSVDGGATWTALGAVTDASALLLADNGQSRLYFQPNANFNGNAASNALTFRAWDQTTGSSGAKVNTGTNGGTTAFSSATDTVAVTVTAVNDAPVLQTTDDRQVNTINEDTTNKADTWIPSFMGTMSDVDAGAQQGVAIIGADSTNGTWYYTLNDGTTWTAFGAVSEGNALLLANITQTRVAFVPNADYNGVIPAALTIRGWDRTTGTNGGRGDASVNGGTTAFSTATDTVRLTVNAQGDINNDSFTLNEDTPTTLNVLGNDNFESPGRTITAINGAAITAGGPGVPAGNGMIWLNADGTLRYQPNPDYSGGDSFTYTVASGGMTETATVSIGVVAVNDAPRVDLDSTTAGTGYVSNYDMGLASIGNLISLTDPDGDDIRSVSIRIVGATAADSLSVFGMLPSGVTGEYNAATGTYTIWTNANAATYQAALNQIRFATTSGTPGTRTLEVVVISANAMAPSNTAVATFNLLDTDGDGVANAGDLDSDNDGILNREEGGSAGMPYDFGTWSPASSYETQVTGNYGDTSITVTSDKYFQFGKLFDPAFYPPEYGISGQTPAIWTYQAGHYSVAFDPQSRDTFVILSSIGRGDMPVSIEFGGPIEIVWSKNLVVNSATRVTGMEGHLIIRLKGDVSNFSFDTLSNESYIGLSFGRDSQSQDTDRDGVFDHVDLDSDNDGITDNVEAQTTAGYKPPSGQGAAMVDVDRDGLDDVYDANTADKKAAASLGLKPVDTDADGTRDYLDTDSDNDGKADIAERGDGAPTSITSTADTDKDGLFDIFEGVNANDGYDVNDQNYEGGVFLLGDQDGDTAADGSNAGPMATDLDYRDNLSAPVIDLNSNANDGNGLRDNTVSYTGGSPAVKVSTPTADVDDVGANNLGSMRIVVGGVLDGAAEIVNIGGVDFVLNADSTRTISLGGTDFSVAYTVAAGFVISNAAGGVMPQAALDALVQSVSYRNTSVHASAGNRTLSFTASTTTATSSNTAVATIEVITNNVGPAGSNDGFPVIEDMPAIGNVLANDTDADGDALSVNGFTIAGDATVYAPGSTAVIDGVGTLTIAANGDFVFTPAPNYNGPVPSVGYTVADGFGGTSSATLTLGPITPMEDPPVITDPGVPGQNFDPSTGNFSVTTPEEVPVNGQVTATDPDGDALTFSLGDGPTSGTLVLEADGRYTYTPNDDFNGVDSFTVLVEDGNGNVVQSVVTITVTPVQDPPLVVDPEVPGQTYDPVAGEYYIGTPEDTPVSGQVAATDADGDSLSYTLGGGAAHGSVVVNLDGTYTYTPNGNYNGSDSFVVTVDDGNGGVVNVTVQVTIDPVNDAPVAGSDSYATAEDTAVPLDLLSNDSDVEDGKPTIESINGVTLMGGAQTIDVAGGQVVIAADGTMQFVPEANYNGPVSFDYVAVDSEGGTAAGSVGITVGAVNDAPTVTDPGTPGQTVDLGNGTYAITTNEDTAFNGQIGATDVDGDSLGYAVGSGPAHGTVVVNPDGTYTYTPNTNYNGGDSFVVTVSDGQGGVTNVTVNVTVDAVNDAPVANSDSYTTAEDTAVPLDLLSNDSDVEDGKPTIESINGVTLTGGAQSIDVAGGQVVIAADGTMQFVPDANYNGSVSFDYVAVDSEGGTAAGSVGITVGAVNDAPTVTDPGTPGQTVDLGNGTYAITTNEDTAFNGQIGATDVDGDSLAYAVGSGPAHGTVVVNPDGTYTYTPNTNYNGGDSFVVSVSDGNGGVTNVTVNVTVNAVNDAPVAGNDSYTTSEDTAVPLDLLPNDSDVEDGKPTIESINGVTLTGGAQTIDVTGGQVVVAADGTMQFVPEANYNGPVSFAYVAIDSEGGTATGSVSITVGAVNDAPTVTDPGTPGQTVDLGTGTYAITTNEDTAFNGQIGATDVDGDSLGYAVGSGPAHGNVTVNPDGSYTYTPNTNYNGGDSFVVSVSDGNGGVTNVTVNVTVNAVNDAPVAGNDSYTTSEDTAVPLDLLSNDSDVEDGKPTIESINGVTLTGGAKTIDVTGGQVVVAADGTMQFVPELNYNGPVSFAYVAIDSEGGTATGSVSINVTPVQDAPQIVDPGVPGQNYDPSTGNYSVSTPEDTPVSGKVAATDADGDSLSFSAGTGPSHGTVVVNPDGTYTYTPNANYNGSDSFTVRVDDGQGNVVTSTINVGITPVQDAPQVVDPNVPGQNYDPSTGTFSVSTPEDTPVSGQVFAIDPDGDALVFTPGTGPSNGTVVVNPDGTYTYTPNPDFNGSDSFTVLVDDGHGNVVESTVQVNVAPVQDAPQIVDPNVPGQNYDPSTGNFSISTPEDTPVAGQVAATDADGDSLVFTAETGPSHGTVVVRPDGSYIYRPNRDYNGSDSFTVLVDDGKGNVVRSTVTVDVTPVQDAPQIVDPGVPGQNYDPSTGNYSISTPEDTPVSGQVAATDADGDSLSFSAGTGPSHGTVVVNPDGTYTYTPNANYNGSDSFTVLVDDGQGNVVTSTINVGITPVQDAPQVVDPNVPGQNYDPSTGTFSVSTPEDTPVSGQVSAIDPDGDALVFTPGAGPSHGTVVVNPDGTYTYTPNPDFNGSDSFTVLVDDGHGNVVESTVQVTVDAVNDAPRATDDFVVTSPDAPVTGNVITGPGLDVDPEGDPMTVTQFTVDADGDGEPETFTVPAGGSATARITDDSGRAIGTLTLGSDGAFTFTPSGRYHGPVPDALYTVSDGTAGDTAVLSFQDVPNRSPSVGNESVTVNEDQPLHVPVEQGLLSNDRDPEGTPLVIVDFTVDGLPGPIEAGQPAEIPGVGVLVVNPDGSYSFTPDAEYSGPVPGVSYTVSDGEGGDATGHLQLEVTSVNDQPTVGSETVDVPNNGGTLDVPAGGGLLVNDGDAEGGTLVVKDIAVDGLPGPINAGTPVEIPGKGTLLVNPDGSYSFTPDPSFQGDLVVTYTVSDGHGGTGSGTLTLQVQGGDKLYRGDYPFVFTPADAAAGRDDGAARGFEGHGRGPQPSVVLDAVEAVASLRGARSLQASGAVLEAVNGVDSLHGTATLGAQGVVLQAVNGIDSLHGVSTPDTARDSALRQHLDGQGFGQPVESIGSLRIGSDLQLELLTHGQQTWIEIGHGDASGAAQISAVHATLADGHALPSWIRVDGQGHIALDRPAGTEQLTLRLAVERRGGESRTHVIEIDFNASTMRPLGESTSTTTKDKAGKDGANTASLDFATQLAQASRRDTSVDDELMELLG